VSFSDSVHCNCLGKVGSSIPGNVGEGVRVLGVFGGEFGGDFLGEDGLIVFEGILRPLSPLFGEGGGSFLQELYYRHRLIVVKVKK